MLLEWNNDLIKQGERSTGSTALTLPRPGGSAKRSTCCSKPRHQRRISQTGMNRFPYMWPRSRTESRRSPSCSTAAMTAPSCATPRAGPSCMSLSLRIASRLSPTPANCRATSSRRRFLNMQDKDGNTALHLAVRFGNLWIFNPLMKNCLVKLNLTNSKGQTLLDLSWIMTPVGVHYGLVSNPFF